MMTVFELRSCRREAKPGGNRLYCSGCRKVRVAERLSWGPVRCTVCKATIHGRG